jgi:leucyl-tRNA synthetase
MDYVKIHGKWRKFWEENGVNNYNPKKPNKYYCLEMFSYPSGASLHMGHFFNFAPSDTHARFKRMAGFNVFQPMGFDAFGLPAENHALKTGGHPRENTAKNMEIMRRQLGELGGMYDWNYSFATCEPEYYRWTQWLFLKLYHAGLAYQKSAPVNWCDKCKTVLANEQVTGGECERCGTAVTRRNMTQWFFKITDYAEKLLSGLDELDWPNKTKVMQRNWIGKSIGATVNFEIAPNPTARPTAFLSATPTAGGALPLPDSKLANPAAGGVGEVTSPTNSLSIFTTRIDTLPGVTFMVVAPEHAALPTLITDSERKNCEKYVAEALKKSEVERQITDREKTGAFTGSFAINPLNGNRVPIYIADYVLANYGTGAIMAVPAHDDRDRAFAEKFKLPIIEVPYLIPDKNPEEKKMSAEKKRIIAELNKIKKGTAAEATTFRLRDWSVSRQRYWGAPIPIVYCEKCGAVPVPEADLPVQLPNLQDFKPRGAAPLANAPEFVGCTCPRCGKPARRECETMDTFVCSSWYFLRYPFAKRADIPFDKTVSRVDKYVGGAEHSCGHLIYSRFINRFLHDQGLVPFAEPFPSLVHQGMILAADGSKMSKSKGNTVTPDKYVAEFGSDILRLYMLFGFNYTEGGPWNDDTLKSVTRFTERVDSLVRMTGGSDFPQTPSSIKTAGGLGGIIPPNHSIDKNLLHVQAVTIAAVRENLDSFSFNTAVARCMEFLNALEKHRDNLPRECVKNLVLLLAPMVPHLAEEWWEMLGEKPSVFDAKFPEADKRHLVLDEIEIAVQINSKIAARIMVPSEATQAEVEKLCKKWTEGKAVKKVVFVKGRLINFIV